MTPAKQHNAHSYEFGSFCLILKEHRLYRQGEQVMLPPKEVDLLLLLVQNAGQVMLREHLIKALWPNTVVEEANLNVHISALRKALAEGQGEQQFIETLPRLGYRFLAPVTQINECELVSNEKNLLSTTRIAEKNSPQQEPLPITPAETVIISTSPPSIGTIPKKNSSPLWIIAITVIGLVSFSLFKLYTLKEGRSEATTAFNVIPLTTYPGRELQPSFSPDGNQVAFVWRNEKETNGDIYIRLVDGGNRVQITNHPGDDVNPVWSPDGRTIAFYRSSPEGDGIYLIPSLGGAERKLMTVWANRFGFGSHTWLHWSPDGKWLVVSDKSSAEEPFSLYLVSPETGDKRRLSEPPSATIGDCSPAFSPDGKTIAFVRVISAVVGEVQLIPVTGGPPQQLTFDGAGASNLTWVLEGSEIVFSSRYAGKSRLMRLPVNGGSPQWLAASGNEALYPAFSPHGKRLVWAQNTDNTDLYRISLSHAESTAVPTSLVASTAMEVSPRYSPDGKRIVFVSNRAGSDELWVSGSEGENPVSLTSFRGPLGGSPSWSPDGKWIAFDCRPGGNSDIFIINSEGGQPRRLTTDPAEDAVPSWSQDGHWIYFTSHRSGRLQIWKTTTDGNETVQVTKLGGFEAMESLDGQWIYFTKDRGSSEIWRLPVNGGQEMPVFDFQQKNYSRMWVVQATGIYFTTAEPQGRARISFYNFANEKIKTIAEFEGNLRNGVNGLTCSPDGNWILFPFNAQRGCDLLMIENFH